MKRIVFRVDASSMIGIGHVMRCLALAEELRLRGAGVSFICRAHEGHLATTIRSRAFPVVVLPLTQTDHTPCADTYESWLGAAAGIDAAQTIEALEGTFPDWLIADHYGIDAQWEKQLRDNVRSLLVIDDLANRPHDCDVLIDQNYATNAEDRYEKLISPTCRLLTGPRYALLERNYAACGRAFAPRDGTPRKVLIFFGGSDPQNMTSVALETLSRDEFTELDVDIVVGVNNRHRELIERAARSRSRTTVHGPRRDLVGLMAEADFAIGAGGVTTWERMCMGLPTIVVSIADNQKPACEALAHSRLIYYAGDSAHVGPDKLAELINGVISNVEGLAELRVRNRDLVDGFGAGRVAESIFPSSAIELRCVSAPKQTTDSERLGQGQNETGDLLLEANGVPLGRMRYEEQSENIYLEWTTEPLIAQRGWEASFVTRAMAVIQASTPVTLGDPPVTYFFTRSRPTIRERHLETKSYSIVMLSDATSWTNEYIPDLLLGWINDGHRVLWAHDKENLRGADFCFMLGCGQIVPESKLAQFRNCLVVHESDLPEGKGWSPLTWQILEGKRRVPVTLLEAARKVDSGPIYAQEWLTFRGDELIEEMRAAVANSTLELCRKFVREYPQIKESARHQTGTETFYRRRTPEDSRLDMDATIESQFDLLRVVDDQRYPAFFEARGHRYVLGIRRESKP